jgi:hypothetical protein
MKQKSITKDKSKKACEIAKAYCCENELVHGMPHINRMLKNFKKLKSGNQSINKVGEKILDAVELAIKLHDIGRKYGEEEHGSKSLEILEKECGDFLKNEKWTKYAIFWHKPTKDRKYNFPNKLKDPIDICLLLLFALDNMDAVGEIGVHRDFKDMKGKIEFKWFPDKISGYRNGESFLERLLKNYLRIDKNYDRLEKIKNIIKTEGLLKYYQKLKKEQEKYLLELIKNKRLKITDKKIKKILAVDDFCK